METVEQFLNIQKDPEQWKSTVFDELQEIILLHKKERIEETSSFEKQIRKLEEED